MSLKETLDAIERKARKEGFKEGFQEGFKDGFQEGFQEGFKVGLDQGRLEVAKRLIAKGLDNAVIAELTDFKMEQIEQRR